MAATRHVTTRASRPLVTWYMPKAAPGGRFCNPNSHPLNSSAHNSRENSMDACNIFRFYVSLSRTFAPTTLGSSLPGSWPQEAWKFVSSSYFLAFVSHMIDLWRCSASPCSFSSPCRHCHRPILRRSGIRSRRRPVPYDLNALSYHHLTGYSSLLNFSSSAGLGETNSDHPNAPIKEWVVPIAASWVLPSSKPVQSFYHEGGKSDSDQPLCHTIGIFHCLRYVFSLIGLIHLIIPFFQVVRASLKS